MNIDTLGSRSVHLNWESNNNNSVYKIDVLKFTSGETVATLETQNTDIVLQNLNPSTKYTFNIQTEKQTVSVPVPVTSITFNHPTTNVHMTLTEMEIYDSNDNYMSSGNFTLSGSASISSYPPANSMNRNVDTTRYQSGTAINPSSNTHLKIDFNNPTAINYLRIYYWNSSNYIAQLPTCNIAVTYANGEIITYDNLQSIVDQTVNIEQITEEITEQEIQERISAQLAAESEAAQNEAAAAAAAALLISTKTSVTIKPVSGTPANSAKIHAEKFIFRDSNGNTLKQLTLPNLHIVSTSTTFNGVVSQVEMKFRSITSGMTKFELTFTNGSGQIYATIPVTSSLLQIKNI